MNLRNVGDSKFTAHHTILVEMCLRLKPARFSGWVVHMCRHTPYRIGAMNLFNLGLNWIKEQTENIDGISINVGVQSITPRCNDIQSLVGKNVVEFQELDKELRVSYKPTSFRRWVVHPLNGDLVWQIIFLKIRPSPQKV